MFTGVQNLSHSSKTPHSFRRWSGVPSTGAGPGRTVESDTQAPALDTGRAGLAGAGRWQGPAWLGARLPGSGGWAFRSPPLLTAGPPALRS